ncbi:MAG TPA: fatty acyl-AMP ligase [Thermoanaerobaculia bacterium]|jgi:acyl-CoA synthetase (AMP-forming)/AMP-acid ligase II|nr:fatty acyl-AMP ligase [Thermoanaerobaculia bacterium]
MTSGYRTLVDMLRTRAQCDASRVAYTFLVDGECEGDRLTYKELDRRARSIAVLLADRGVRPGDRALLLYPPGLDFIPAFFGCLYAGVIAVPSYPPHPGQVARALPRLLAITADAEASVVLCVDAVASMAASLSRLAPALHELTWLATDTLADRSAQWREPVIDVTSLAFLQYTSGSTSAPKGVMVSHGNLLHNLGYADYVEENDRTSIAVSWLPVIHDMGLIEGVLEPAYAGYPAYLMAPASFLQRPIRWLDAITRYGATNCGGPNFAYDLCVRKIAPAQRRALDLSSWRVAYNGAEPIRRDTLVAFHEAFRDFGFRWKSFYPVYGLAEATLVVSSGRRNDEPVICEAAADLLSEAATLARGDDHTRVVSLVSSGPASYGTRVLIVDPQSLERCPPDRVGEIWIDSPSVAGGYWRRPAESAECFQAHTRDGDGPFLRTGDLGVLRDGELFVTGRLKDLLIVRGHKHYPQDLELTAEQQHEIIRPGCVAAFAVEVGDQETVAIVAEVNQRALSRNSGEREGTLAQVVASVRRGVADQHGIQLAAVSLIGIGALPKTSSGKLQRQACRAAFHDASFDELMRWTQPVVLDQRDRAPASRPALREGS